QSWNHSFWACCSPPSTCFAAWCCACFLFGKTHHRLRKNANLEEYAICNTSCVCFYLAGHVCFNCFMTAMQRQDIRRRYNVKGSRCKDILASFCCQPCALMQSAKETKLRAG
ncbi:PLAC8-domain-containing protein, partial [Byssothecium circinans]